MTAPTNIRDLHDICVFDLETTGIDSFGDRIVTAYLGRMNRDCQITGSYNWLIDPGIPIPTQASDVHGISDEVAQRDGRDPKAAVAEILDVLRRSIASGRPTVVYNASYDLTMLNEEARRHGLEPIADFGVVIDPMIIDGRIDKYRKGKRTLVRVAEHYGVNLEGAHDAEADSVATGGVAWAVLERLPDQPLAELHAAQIDWASERASGLQKYFRLKDPEAIVDGAWPERTPPAPAPTEVAPEVSALSQEADEQGRVEAGNGIHGGEFGAKVQRVHELAHLTPKS